MTTATLPNRTLVDRPAWQRLGLLVAFWSAVALFGGTAEYLAQRGSSPSLTWAGSMSRPLLAALLWVPLTLLASAGARAYPPFVPGGEPRVRVAGLIGHGVASLSASFVLNFLFFLIVSPRLGLTPGEFFSTAGNAGVRLIHLNAGVYWAIVLGTIGLQRMALAGAPPTTSEEAFEQKLKVRSRGASLLVPVADIRWIEGAGDYVRLHLAAGARLHSDRLKRLEERLDPTRFVRVHRSTIVNVEAVEELRPIGHGDYEATLAGGDTVRVSRTRRARLLQMIDGGTKEG